MKPVWVLCLALLISVVEGLVLPYEFLAPAKVLLIMWHGWFLDNWGSFGKNGQLQEGDKCDVPEETTLQWAYFMTLLKGHSSGVTIERTSSQIYPSVTYVATHFTFFKSKLYPFRPRQSSFDFCEYWNKRLVCDTSLNKCVPCKFISNGNPVLNEACNPQRPTIQELPNAEEGLALYKSIKIWVSKITREWKKQEGERCTANARQTLALTQMRKLLPRDMYNGRDAGDKRDYEAEWKVIKAKFENLGGLENVRKDLLDFNEGDVAYTYCSPSGDDGQSYTLDGTSKLVCDGNNCIACMKNGIWRVPVGYLREACTKLGVIASEG